MEEKELTIDFDNIWKVIKEGKWIISLIGLLFAIITAIVEFNKPNEYTSVASVLPEVESSLGGGLSKYAGLASLAGVNIGNMEGSDAIRPDLYPNVINNTSFFLYLLEQKVSTSEGEKKLFKDFYYSSYGLEVDSVVKNKRGVFEGLRSVFGIKKKNVVVQNDLNGQVIFISKENGKVINNLMGKIVATMDKKSYIISISVELPDPVTAANVAQISMNYLTNFVTNYRTEKTRRNLDFLASQLRLAKGKYYSTQSKKAQYSDQFQSATIRLQSADIQRERIETDYRVNSTFYKQLLEQYETAKLKVEQETPVFNTLQQPIVPYEKSGPSRIITVIFFSIFGCLLCSLVLLLKKIQTIIN